MQISASHSARSRRRSAIGTFRHQDHTLAIGCQRCDQRAHLVQVLRLRDHELELIIIARHQLAEDVGLDAQPLVLRRPSALRRGVRQLRADAHQVARHRLEHRARGLDGDVQARRRASRSVSSHDLRRDHRLAAGHDHVARRMRPHLVHESRRACSSSPSGCHEVYGVSHHEQRRLQPLVRTKTDGTPTSDALALDRIEHLSDLQCRASSNPLRRSRQESHCAARRARRRRDRSSCASGRKSSASSRRQLHDLRFRQSCISGVWMREPRAAFHAGLGRQVRHALERLDEFRPAIGIAGIVERIHADENVGRLEHLRPGQREGEKNRVARRHVGDRDAVLHLLRRPRPFGTAISAVSAEPPNASSPSFMTRCRSTPTAAATRAAAFQLDAGAAARNRTRARSTRIRRAAPAPGTWRNRGLPLSRQTAFWEAR